MPRRTHRTFSPLVVGVLVLWAVALIGPTQAAARTTRIGVKPCTSLSLDSVFPPPPGNVWQLPVSITKQTVSHEPGLLSGSVCMIRAIPKTCSACAASPLGAADLLTFTSDSGAEHAFAVIRQNVFSDGNTPAHAGDEALVATYGGAVRVDNDVFFFRWLPKDPAEADISVVKVLSRVASALTHP